MKHITRITTKNRYFAGIIVLMKNLYFSHLLRSLEPSFYYAAPAYHYWNRAMKNSFSKTCNISVKLDLPKLPFYKAYYNGYLVSDFKLC